MDYGFTHNGKVYTPNRTADIDAAESDARNKAIEAAELECWKGKPDDAIGYYSFPVDTTALWRRRDGSLPIDTTAGVVSTWLGAKLGDIVEARVYRHNFGGQMVSLRVKGTNGAMYYGRASWDNGTIVRLHRMR